MSRLPFIAALLLECLALVACSSESADREQPDGSVLGTGGAGAGSGLGGGGPDSSPSGRQLQLQPGDLTTNHDATSVRVAVSAYAYGVTPSTPILATLHRLPSDEIVPSTVVEEATDGSANSASWVVQPSALLVEGWYALVVANDGHSSAFMAHQREDGSFETRFRIGSDPLLIAVGACASDDEAFLPKLRLEFSELVTGTAPIQVLSDGSPVTCVVYDPPSEYGMGLTCTPAPTASAAISVEIGIGFTSSASGLALATSSGSLPRTFELPKTAYATESCRYWREASIPAE